MILIVNVPVVAELLAVSVRTLLDFVGFVPKDAVVPLPMPLADNVTEPRKLDISSSNRCIFQQFGVNQGFRAGHAT